MEKSWCKNYTKQSHCNSPKAQDSNVLREGWAFEVNMKTFSSLLNIWLFKEITIDETASTTILTQGVTNWFINGHIGVCQNIFAKSKSKKS